MLKRRRPEVFDTLKIDFDLLVVEELFRASDVRWVRASNKKGENRYFSEREWIHMVYKVKR